LRGPQTGHDGSDGKMIIRRAVPGDASGIARVCAEGWRDTYQNIYPADEIDTVIADYYAPERITAEIIAPEGWDGWIVAVGLEAAA
jgi:hypothetical protein